MFTRKIAALLAAAAIALTACGGAAIIAFLRRAGAPQRMKTRGFSRAESSSMMRSVNCSQPCPWCEAAAWARTVSTVFKSSTPCFAHGARQPLFGVLQPRSLESSSKMFLSDGGGSTPACTEKESPCACPSP